MTDQQFLHAFESGHLLPADFHHRDHLRLAWLEVDRRGLEAGTAAVAGGIRRFAEAHGHHRLYHETLTRFWVRIVAHASEQTFDATLARHPMLLQKDLPLRHWTSQTLYGDAARDAWIEPDVTPLPFA
jgi:hypothetical protein